MVILLLSVKFPAFSNQNITHKAFSLVETADIGIHYLTFGSGNGAATLSHEL